jgi:hypothetical protein
MKPHKWSHPITVYEILAMWKCRGCGAILLHTDVPDNACVTECRLPIDCDEAVLAVIHESYVGGWTYPWADEKEGDFEWP